MYNCVINYYFLNEAQAGETVQVEIFGKKENADAAEAHIRHCIVSCTACFLYFENLLLCKKISDTKTAQILLFKIVLKEKLIRKELGGDTRFVCFVCGNENETFCFEHEKSPPKLNGFIQGQRYRIQTEAKKCNEGEEEVTTINILHVFSNNSFHAKPK